jgi:hypothetical protein
MEASGTPDEGPLVVGEARLVCGSTGNVDAERHLLHLPSLSLVDDRATSSDGTSAPDIRQQGSDAGPVTEFSTGRLRPGDAPARLVINRREVV